MNSSVNWRSLGTKIVPTLQRKCLPYSTGIRPNSWTKLRSCWNNILMSFPSLISVCISLRAPVPALELSRSKMKPARPGSFASKEILKRQWPVSSRCAWSMMHSKQGLSPIFS